MATPSLVARWVHRLLCGSASDQRAWLADRWAARRGARTRVYICEIQLGVPFWKCNGSRLAPGLVARLFGARWRGPILLARGGLPSVRIPETVLMRNGHARVADPFERVRDNGSAIFIKPLDKNAKERVLGMNGECTSRRKSELCLVLIGNFYVSLHSCESQIWKNIIFELNYHDSKQLLLWFAKWFNQVLLEKLYFSIIFSIIIIEIFYNIWVVEGYFYWDGNAIPLYPVDYLLMKSCKYLIRTYCLFAIASATERKNWSTGDFAAAGNNRQTVSQPRPIVYPIRRTIL